MDYPDDDLDAMLDDELEIMNDIEKENQPVSPARNPARKSLEFSSSVSLGGARPLDGNVGIGLSENNLNKRQRSQGEEEEEEEDLWKTNDEDMEMFRSEKSPSSKRMKIMSGGDASPVTTTTTTTRRPEATYRKIYRRIPDGDFQSVTCPDGTRFYLKVSAEPEDGPKAGSPAVSELCGTSYYQLYQAATGEINRLATASHARDLGQSDQSSRDPSDQDQTELWVEKYRPRSYMELLSDDGTNRTLLMWLKLWDKLVFNKERRVREKKEEAEKPKFSSLPEVTEEFDSQGRPVQQVALLHGPPGLGKTTLAHIVARHAGYRVVEMNASDDRSLEAFTRKFENSTQMKSVMTEEKKPICLIIDEIDGSPAPTINYLVSVISGKLTDRKKKGGDRTTIRRPIICICNDLYTASLRPLRKLALVIPFPPTLSSRLASRLKEITASEKLQADLTALLALCKKSENDIRSCLSTLQFLKKQSRYLKSSDVSKINLGTKDSQKSSLKVLDEIFSIPRGANENESKQTVCSPAQRFRIILGSVQSCGEYDRVVAGVFENYINMKFKDNAMENVVKGLDWFSEFDLLHSEMLHSQVYSIMAYLPFTLVMAHFMFASTVKQRVTFPSQAYEVSTKLSRSQNILASLVAEMSPRARVFCSNTSLVREVLPAILSVIQPALRNVNTQLFSAKEKAELANVVAVHIAYNLTYKQERDLETGQYVYKMDPDVESIVCFSGAKRLINLSYGTKQMIAREINEEKIRLEGKSQTGSQQARSFSPTEEAGDVERTPKGSKKTTNHLQKLTAKTFEVKTKTPTDFFGRTLKVNPVNF